MYGRQVEGFLLVLTDPSHRVMDGKTPPMKSPTAPSRYLNTASVVIRTIFEVEDLIAHFLKSLECDTQPEVNGYAPLRSHMSLPMLGPRRGIAKPENPLERVLLPFAPAEHHIRIFPTQ